jgi:hypothetical protein
VADRASARVEELMQYAIERLRTGIAADTDHRPARARRPQPRAGQGRK